MTLLVGIAAVLLVGWFAAGTIWNVRRGSEVMRWMQDGLPVLGARTRVRWLGSSVVELVLQDASSPFGSATVLVFMEPRDLPWWPLSRLRGRRDTLIVRGVLRRAPAVEFEAIDPSSWSGRDALPRIPQEWKFQDESLRLRGESAAAFDQAKALLAATSGLRVRRLSVRRAEPHFQLHVDLPDRGRPAREFFDMVRSMAARAS